jgi:hypothetical protein
MSRFMSTRSASSSASRRNNAIAAINARSKRRASARVASRKTRRAGDSFVTMAQNRATEVRTTSRLRDPLARREASSSVE